MSPIVYIDQCHLQDSKELRFLRARALRRQLVAPASVPHLVETLRAWPARREEIVAALIDLARGRALHTEGVVLMLEAEAARSGFDHSWVRAQVTTRNVWDWATGEVVTRYVAWKRRHFPKSVEWLFRRVVTVPDHATINDIVQTRSRRGVADANRRRPPPPTMRKLLSDYGATGRIEDGIPDDRLDATFRTLASRLALQRAIGTAKPSGMHENDPMDIFFLSVALPYLDAVCVDKAMYARIEEARGGVGMPWARAFKRLPDLLDWLGPQ